MPRKQYRPGCIKRNHSNALPRYVLSYDAETFPDAWNDKGRRRAHKFRLGVGISCRIRGVESSGEGIERIRTTDEFWGWLYSHTQPRATTWLVGHNILFDLIVSGFADEMLESRLVVDWPRSERPTESPEISKSQQPGVIIIESPPTIIAVRHVETGGRIVMLDTMNWFRSPLYRLGEACGFPKLEMPEFSAPDEEWFRYCERDTRIAHETFLGLIKWVKENDFGMFRYTAPSQSMSAYRHRFMEKRIYPHDNPDAKLLERTGYFGGRTEVFRYGEINETVYHLDINSLFPSIMHDSKLPCYLQAYETSDKYLPHMGWIDYDRSIAEVELDTDEGIYPVRADGITIYPVGQFRTILCGPELQRAHSKGFITGIKSFATYRLDDLFSKWVKSMWDMRQEYKANGNDLYEQITKTFLNSLYGKFGQRSPKWVDVYDDLSMLPFTSEVRVDHTTKERTFYRSFGWQVQKQVDPEEIGGTFVAIPAFITSLARTRMNQIRRTIGKQNCYYQGVDGVIVNREGYENLLLANEVDSAALGKLRLQVTANYGEILGCCDYKLNEKVTISGRSGKFENDEFGRTWQRKFHAISQLFKGGPTNEVIEEVSEWVRRGGSRKGTIGDGGWMEPLVRSL